MPVTWKVLQTERFDKDIAKNVITIEVDFGDGYPPFPRFPDLTYKRMHVPSTDSAAIVAAVEGWLRDYIPGRANELAAMKEAAKAAAVTSKKLVGKTQRFAG